MSRGPQEQFTDAIRASGLESPDTIEDDGKLHRFATNGKRGHDSGWYVYYGDGIPVGSFGDWRGQLTQTWRADIGRKLSPAEARAHSQRMQDAHNEREQRRRADMLTPECARPSAGTSHNRRARPTRI
jgi:putative DNA primase/helicase